MQTIRYFEGGLEDMDEYIIRLLDGRQISLKMATSDEVASADFYYQDEESGNNR